MNHECDVCNTEFESKSTRAKYCPDCRKLSKAQRKKVAAEAAAVTPVNVITPVPEYKSPDVVPAPEPVEIPPVEEEPAEPDTGRRACKTCGAEYTVKRGKGGCPMCALDRHFGIKRI